MSRASLNIAFLAGLLIVILLTFVWQSTNNRVITIFPNDNYTLYAQSDALELGGQSTSRAERENDKLVLHCEIVKSNYAWPFCNVTISLAEKGADGHHKGIDLSRFTSIELSARYRKHTNLNFRVQMRNFNPEYSVPDRIESWKFLTTEFQMPQDSSSVEIPLNALQVPNWWLNYSKVPIALSTPEYSQIMVFELATGNGIPPGKYEIEVDKIQIFGKYLHDDELFKSLVITITVIIFAYLVNSIRLERMTVHKQREKVIELSEINRFLKLKNESLQDKVNVDALTGVLNRHASETIFPALKNGDSLIIMDIDHFKAINDNFGHDIGDKVLLIFARVINNKLRKNDYFIRWGGEEFVSICLNTSAVEAEKIAKKFRQELKKTVWPREMSVTCSFGVAEMSYGESADMLLKRADSALYQSKQDGRDRITVS